MKLPPFNTFPTLNSNRITLRQIQTADIPDIIEISFYDAVQASTLKEATEMLERINEDYQHGNSIHWGISDNSSGKIVGTCGYYRGFDEGAGELGCILLPLFRGKGLMTIALQVAIDFGLKHIRLRRIWAATSKENHKAQIMLDRLNFIKLQDMPGEEIEYELRRKHN